MAGFCHIDRSRDIPFGTEFVEVWQCLPLGWDCRNCGKHRRYWWNRVSVLEEKTGKSTASDLR